MRECIVRFGYRDYDPVVGRFTSPDPLDDTGGDHDVYDYCVDDPVSMTDPTGLLGAIVKQGVRQAGKSAGKSFFNEELSSSEKMFDVRNRIIENETKINDGTATDENMKQLEKDRLEENELWKKYGNDYEGANVYRPYFPDDDYARRKREEVGRE